MGKAAEYKDYTSVKVVQSKDVPAKNAKGTTVEKAGDQYKDYTAEKV